MDRVTREIKLNYITIWSLILGLAFRLWPARRGALGVLVAGSVAVYLVTAAIGFLNYGIWKPQAQAGLALICGATFVADEKVPPEIAYPHKFAAATVTPRTNYENASSWAEKYRIIDEYYCGKTWEIAMRTVIDRESQLKLDCFSRLITLDRTYMRTALPTIVWNPLGYLKMAVVKFFRWGANADKL